MSLRDKIIIFVTSSQETTDDHPHLDTIIAALGQVQNNGKYVLFLLWKRKHLSWMP